MATKRDYYDILGVTKNASPDEVKKAYRKVAMKFHPDRNPGDKAAEEKFREASEAYEVLSNEDKRHRYDQHGHEGLKSSFGQGGFNYDRDFTHGADLSDILNQFFGGGGGGFGGFGGGGQQQRRSNPNAPRQGDDIQFNLEIDFEEAIFGSKRDIALNVNDTCETCNGSGAEKGSTRETCKHCGGRGSKASQGGIFGMIMQETCPVCCGEGSIIKKPCKKCRGAGLTSKRKNFSVSIPAGIDSGMRIRLSGQGNSGANGGPHGDAYAQVSVRESELFQREGSDLICRISISPALMALGGEIEIPTPNGEGKLKIPAGSDNGKVFRLRGQGVPGINRRPTGDLHIVIYAEVPQSLSKKAKEALEAFKAETDGSTHMFPKQASQIRLSKRFSTRREALRNANK